MRSKLARKSQDMASPPARDLDRRVVTIGKELRHASPKPKESLHQLHLDGAVSPIGRQRGKIRFLGQKRFHARHNRPGGGYQDRPG